jgi:hypothetical protein
MASLGKMTLTSASDQRYRFRVFPLGTRFRSISGVYLITQRINRADGRHRHKILYVGHTKDFSRPLERRPKAPDFTKYGANCICVLSDVSSESCRAKERDLITSFSPVCNAASPG